MDFSSKGILKKNLHQNLNDIKLGLLSFKKFKKHNHVTENFIKNLNLEEELKGHEGCVNCLEWNDTGEFLVSGSDDNHIIIWDPFNHTIISNISTMHKGNIFSVKFLPKFNNTKLASGAADFLIKVIDLSKEIVIESYKCHLNRVKRLAVSYDEPYLLWSCSEDGTVRQLDIRESPPSSYQSANVLLHLSSNIGTNTELKCLAINPMRSNQIAVGCNDPYVRLYDRRKLSLKTYENSTENITRLNKIPTKTNTDFTFRDTSGEVVQYFIPGHIPLSNHSGHKSTTTYVTFSPDGSNLLVNMGTEQVYLYDVNKVHPITNFQTSVAKNVANCDNELYCDYSSFKTTENKSAPFIPDMSKRNTVIDDKELMSFLNSLKEQGNKMYKNSDFHSAVKFYNEALKYNRDYCANFYANRAAAYIARNWIGDTYAALIDSMRALQIDSGHIKSHFRIAQCFYQLNLIAEAHDYIIYLQYLFPEQSKKFKQIEELQKKITDKVTNFLENENKEVSDEQSENGSNNSNMKATIDIANVTNLLEIINKNTRTRRYLESKSFSAEEFKYRSESSDYVNRYCGHCNTSTDIKEANFFGIDGQFIIAGSDDGNIFFWDRQTENIVRVLHGDAHIVNCLQPHPSICMLATSGIENVVRLWTPNSRQGKQGQVSEDDNCQSEEEADNDIGQEQNELRTTKLNQERLKADPFDVVFLNMGVRTTIMREYDFNDNDTEDSDTNNDGASSSGDQATRSIRRILIENTDFCRTT